MPAPPIWGGWPRGRGLRNCRREFGIERPALTRYVEWTLGAVQGDFGMSFKRKTPISETVGTRFRNTVVLGATASMVGVPLAILLGIVAALWRDRSPDLWVSTTAIFAMTIPEFVSSTVLILVFSVWLGWLPGIVTTPPDAPLFEFVSDIILPVVALALVMTAHILRMVRTSVIDVMASDYVQMARPKGCSLLADCVPARVAERPVADHQSRRLDDCMAAGGHHRHRGGVQLSRARSIDGPSHILP